LFQDRLFQKQLYSDEMQQSLFLEELSVGVQPKFSVSRRA